MNIGELLVQPDVAERKVLHIQSKLHRWANSDIDRCFADLYNFVYDPAVLVVAWRRVVSNRGARSAGVDGQTASYIRQSTGESRFLEEIRADLKARDFAPLPVRERVIPKAGPKRGSRRLGIPAARDRVVQGALKLILEPIFEADFLPCSYGFRPYRRPWDAIAEIRHFGSHGYEWTVEGDIEACFDNISHQALIGRVRKRVGDKRVLALIKRFLHAGILRGDGLTVRTHTGTPQGGVLSPLLANIALSILDEHFGGQWTELSATKYARHKRRRNGQANIRLVRYADDFVLLCDGTRAHAVEAKACAARVLAQVGLQLSVTKTTVTHIDEGFDFLGIHIQRHLNRGNNRKYVYTYPSKAALKTVKAKVKALTTRRTTNLPLEVLLIQLNRTTRGWANYFRHCVAKRSLSYIGWYTYQRVTRWLQNKHHITWREQKRRFYPDGPITIDGMQLFNPVTAAIEYYRYRGNRIPTPWPQAGPRLATA